MKGNKKDSSMSKTFPLKKDKILPKCGDILDNQRYGITKINTNVNNNPFNIILLNKKKKSNKNYIKKASLSNLSVTCPIMNEKHNNDKEIKSENNNDESNESLHNKVNDLLIGKNIKSISPDDIKLGFNSISKNINSKNFSSNNKDKNIYISNNINSSKKYENNLNYNIKIDRIEDNKEEEKDLSQNIINENLKIDNLINKSNYINNKINKKESNKKGTLKLKISRSFTSLPIKPKKGIEQKEKKIIKKKSIVSQDYPDNKNLLFDSINDLMKSVDDNNDNNKEYNFCYKENKRYKNIKEIKDDKNYFRLLYLSSNLIDILKKKSKYQINENENLISDLNNQNYYIYTNDRNVLKLTALFFQKVKKAIFLFNTGKYENAYKSLIEDNIIKNKNMFALFLLTIQGINKEKLYNFLSKNKGYNKNFQILKNYLSFFDFSHQTIIISFNFLLETISIPSKNNDDFISLFVEAYIRDNREMLKKNPEMGKEIKNICGLILKLNNIMYEPDEDKQKKNKEEFINSHINDTTNWNPEFNNLISNDPSTTLGFLNYSNVCGYVFDECIKNENSISQNKHNQYKELFYRKILANNSVSFQNSLNKNELTNINSESNLVDERETKKKKISIISNKKIIYKSTKGRNLKNLIKTNYEEIIEQKNTIEENEINSILSLMKKGEKFSKVININGKTIRINLSLTQDENNIILKKDLCCKRKEILLIDDISECTIGYTQHLKINKRFENYMTILLNTEQIFEFYHSDKKLIQNWVKALDYLVQKRNKVLAMLSQREKISEEEISNIWETDFLCNWSYYRKFIIKKRNKKLEILNNNNKDKIIKIWSLGLPFWLRPNIWKLVILNELDITEVLFQGYFQLVTKEQEKYNIMNKKKQNISIHFNNMNITEENYNIIETISKDCKKIINRIKNMLNDIPDKLTFIKEVFKIIRCFCLYRPDLIYNKNISELAVFFYINCNMNEYDTFVILCNFIINNYFFKYIQNDRLFMKNQLDFFEKLIEKYLPSIHIHFKELQFNTNIFFYKWIEFLFLKTFNYKICLRIFDNFILKGEIFAFEVSIATLYVLRKDILKSDESGLVDLLKKKIININEDILFAYIDNTLDIKKDYNEYFNVYIIGKEKIELLQDL